MPLYEYECDACGHRFEKIQKFSDPTRGHVPEVRRPGPQADLVAGHPVQGQRLLHHRLREEGTRRGGKGGQRVWRKAAKSDGEEVGEVREIGEVRQVRFLVTSEKSTPAPSSDGLDDSSSSSSSSPSTSTTTTGSRQQRLQTEYRRPLQRRDLIASRRTL